MKLACNWVLRGSVSKEFNFRFQVLSSDWGMLKGRTVGKSRVPVYASMALTYQLKLPLNFQKSVRLWENNSSTPVFVALPTFW